MSLLEQSQQIKRAVQGVAEDVAERISRPSLKAYKVKVTTAPTQEEDGHYYCGVKRPNDETELTVLCSPRMINVSVDTICWVLVIFSNWRNAILWQTYDFSSDNGGGASGVTDVQINNISVLQGTIAKIVADLSPTTDSGNLITSGAVAAALVNKLATDGDGSNVTVSFTEAETRANITTGEKLSTLFGKIKKWFSDLKAVAFSGSYNDLTGTPDLSGYVDLTTDQTITGKKTFEGNGGIISKETDSNQRAVKALANITMGAYPSSTEGHSAYQIMDKTGGTNLAWYDYLLGNDGTAQIRLGGRTFNTSAAAQTARSLILRILNDNQTVSFEPSANEVFSLGGNAAKWKDIYASGLLSDGTNSVKITNIIKTVCVCETAANTAAKTVTISNFTLTTGTTLAVYFINKNTVASPTLNVNSTGAKPIYMNNSAATASNLPEGWVLFYYDGSRYQTGNTSNWLQATYSAGANQLRQHCNILAGAAITANRLIYAKSDNKYYVLGAGATINTTMPILYANSAIASGSTGNNNWYIRHQTAAYMFNNGTAVTITAYAPIYIVGKLSGTTFTVDSTNWWTQTVPTVEDGKQYMLMGVAYDTSAVRLLPEHPIYAYMDGAFHQVSIVSLTNITNVKNTQSAYTDTSGADTSAGFDILDKNDVSYGTFGATIGNGVNNLYWGIKDKSGYTWYMNMVSRSELFNDGTSGGATVLKGNNLTVELLNAYLSGSLTVDGTYRYALPENALPQALAQSYLPVCKGVRLWVGNITAGGANIAINSQWIKYNLFRIVIGTSGSVYNTEILATRRGSTAATFTGGTEADTVRGIGGYRGSVNGALQLFDVAFTTATSYWTLITCEQTNITAAGVISHTSGFYIKAIIGVA